MTHVEFFEYPVWEKALLLTENEEKSRMGDIDKKVSGLLRLDKVQPVLFDYRSKDPITKSCRIVLLPTEE